MAGLPGQPARQVAAAPPRSPGRQLAQQRLALRRVGRDGHHGQRAGGHLVMAVGMLDGKIRQAEELSGESIPIETVLRLKHIIVSHHGEYQYGSPKLPMTLEAVALHHLDNLDAKVFSFEQQMKDDPNIDSPWTNYNVPLGRKLYKGRG